MSTHEQNECSEIGILLHIECSCRWDREQIIILPVSLGVLLSAEEKTTVIPNESYIRQSPKKIILPIAAALVIIIIIIAVLCFKGNLFRRNMAFIPQYKLIGNIDYMV